MDRRQQQMTRRESLMYGFGGAAFVCSFNFDRFARPVKGSTSAGARRKLAATFDPFQADVPVAPVLQPVRRSAALDEYAITMKEGSARILPGMETPIAGYEGTFPGPTIRARAGHPVRVTQVNGLGEEMVVHLHGGMTPPGLRRPSGARDRAGRIARLRLPQRPAGRDALVPQPRARQHRPHRLPGARRRSTCSTTRTRSTSTCRGEGTTCR